ENRALFTNVREMSLRWSLKDMCGDLSADIAPLCDGVLQIALPNSQGSMAEQLRIDVAMPDGSLAGTHVLQLGEPKQRKCPAGTSTRPIEHQNVIELSAKGLQVQVDRRYASALASIEGRAILIGGPTVAIFPRQTFPAGFNERDHFFHINPGLGNWRVG